MAQVKVETKPKTFVLSEVEGIFVPDQEVEIALNGSRKITTGEVRKVTNKTFKGKTWRDKDSEAVELRIALTGGDPYNLVNAVTVKSPSASGKILRNMTSMFVRQDKTPGIRLVRQDVLEEMFEAAKDLIYWANAMKQFECAFGKDPFLQWFGAGNDTSDNILEVNRRCANLNQKVQAVTEVVFQCTDLDGMANTNLDRRKVCPDIHVEIGLDKGFRSTRYSWGEKVCTIVHELTHWFLATKDVELEDGTECYGANCIRLANSSKNHALALNNADNWAYYICQFRDRDTSGSERWKYFTKDQIESRGPVVVENLEYDWGMLAA